MFEKTQMLAHSDELRELGVSALRQVSLSNSFIGDKTPLHQADYARLLGHAYKRIQARLCHAEKTAFEATAYGASRAPDAHRTFEMNESVRDR